MIAAEQWNPTWPEVVFWLGLVAGACFCYWVSRR